MVRYNEETTAQGYTFRLQDPEIYAPASVASSSSTINSSTYKERIDSLFRFDDIETEQPEFTVEQLKQQLQDKLFNRQKQQEKSVEESDRSRNFDAARSVVQAHIEKLIETKTGVKNDQLPPKPVGVENPVTNKPPPLPGSLVNNTPSFRQPSLVSIQIGKSLPPPPPQEEKPKITLSFEQKRLAPVPPPPTTDLPRVDPPKTPETLQVNKSFSAILSKQSTPLPPIPSQTAPTPSQIAPSPFQTNPVQISKASESRDEEISKRTSRVFEVDYLGSVVLTDRATSLDALQTPLKELYFRYRNHLLSVSWTKTGSLAIGNDGMRILYNNNGRTDEIFNPFPTIAVWAAVKFVYRKEITGNGSIHRRYAFLPLICDPENQEKQNLFHYLSSEDVELATATHPPMFACVMRKPGVMKILECHAFICSNPEDAVVIAANLYQALLENMKFTQGQKPQTPNSLERRLENSSPDSSNETMFSDTDASTSVPIRPPRRKKRVVDSGSEYETFEPSNRKVGFRRSQRGSTRSRSSMKSNLRRSMRNSQRSKVKRSISERTMTSLTEDNNDLVTKVTLPRSKSFAANLAANSADMSVILNELKSSKGPKSVDDILKVIVNKQGMSFNELEPAYKALLLKLACTLSKDELYYKSKVIMKQQGKPKEQGTSRLGSFLRATKKSVSRLSNKNASGSKPSSQEKTVDVTRCSCNGQRCPSCRPQGILKPVRNSTMMQVQPAPSMPNLHTSCSDCNYDTDSCYSDKCYCSSAPKINKFHQSECETDSCGEGERCYCSVRSKVAPQHQIAKANEMTFGQTKYLRSSSELGHSGSSYFSDTCDTLRSGASSTFASNASGVRRKSSSLLGSETDSIIFASARRFDGFAGLQKFRKNSIGSDYHSNESGDSTGSARGRIISRTAKSLSIDNLTGIGPYVNGSRGSSVASSTSGSRAGSVLSGRSVKSNGSDGAKKVLMVSAIDPTGKVLYRGAQQQTSPDSNNIFAMKKTAEIAALFSDLKLNTTTDIVLGSESDTDSSDDAYSSLKNGFPPQKPAYSGTNLENSLGYLP